MICYIITGAARCSKEATDDYRHLEEKEKSEIYIYSKEDAIHECDIYIWWGKIEKEEQEARKSICYCSPHYDASAILWPLPLCHDIKRAIITAIHTCHAIKPARCYYYTYYIYILLHKRHIIIMLFWYYYYYICWACHIIIRYIHTCPSAIIAIIIHIRYYYYYYITRY